MKTIHHKTLLLVASCLFTATGLFLCALPANAKTVAYWRFEAGPEGGQLAHGGEPDGVFFPGVLDCSGNGNDLSVWAEYWAGFAYRGDVSTPLIPRTGEENNFSVQNTGVFPCLFTASPAMQTMTPAAFTIEVSFKPEWGGYRTLVGRDSYGAATFDPRVSALYLQIQPDNSVAIKFVDVSGVWHEAISAPSVIVGFPWPEAALGRWYNLAAVSDGTILSLYLDDVNAGTGFRLVAQTDMTGSSPNTAITSGLGNGIDWTAGTWSVGRGLYDGNHTDRAYGFIDEVRISDAALKPHQFLFSRTPPARRVTVRIDDTPAEKPVVQVVNAPNGWSVLPGTADPATASSGIITLHGVDRYNAVPELGWRFVVPRSPDPDRTAVDIVRIQHSHQQSGDDNSLQIAFDSARAGTYYLNPELSGDLNAGVVTDKWVELYADDFVVVQYKPHTLRLRE